VPEHRVTRGWEGIIADASIEPVAMHRQLLGQAKDRPLALELGLRPELFRERDLATGAPHLPDERPGNAGAARPYASSEEAQELETPNALTVCSS
jgi:hypothetical protein